MLIMLKTAFQTKALNFEGALDFHVGLSNRSLYLERKSRTENKIHKRKLLRNQESRFLSQKNQKDE